MFDNNEKILNQIKEIDNEVLRCKKCIDKVEKFTNDTTIHFGKDNSILVVGEAPANNGWRKSGKCWYKDNGKITGSGQIMTKLLNIINYKLEDICFVEAVKCFPLSRNNLNYCKTECFSYLEKQISILKPKIILTLGDIATKSLLKNIAYKKFSDVVGNIYSIEINNYTYDVIPIYHPSPISPLSYNGNIIIFEHINELLST